MKKSMAMSRKLEIRSAEKQERTVRAPRCPREPHLGSKDHTLGTTGVEAMTVAKKAQTLPSCSSQS